jgi:hypothetical protein
MVRPPTSEEDSLSSDITNTSLSTESGEFIVSQSPHTTDIQTELSSNRNPYVEQYLNIYYKKSLDQSVSELYILFVLYRKEFF